MHHQATPTQRTYDLPLWLSIVLVLVYFIALIALVFWPGASLLARLRWLDSGICAQIPSHSFYPGGERLPLCARNTGIYLGFIVSLMTLYLTGRGRAQQLPPPAIIALLLVGVIAMIVDGLNSFFIDLGLWHLYQPHNLLRLTTGLLTGMALAVMTLPILNRLFWRTNDEEHSIASWRELVRFLPALILSFFAVATQHVTILYPVALLSTIGLLFVISCVNLILLLTITRREESFDHYRQVLPFFTIALFLSIGELLLLAQGHLFLMQTLGL